MSEIDAETSVVWPVWCYSGETKSNFLPSLLTETVTSLSSKQFDEQNFSNNHQLYHNKYENNNYFDGEKLKFNKIRSKRKPLQAAVSASVTTAASTDKFNDNHYQQHHGNSIRKSSPELEAVLLRNINDNNNSSINSKSSVSLSSSPSPTTTTTVSSLTVSSSLLSLPSLSETITVSPDKMLSDRMLIGLNSTNNNVNNNKKHCDNNNSSTSSSSSSSSSLSSSLFLLNKVKSELHMNSPSSSSPSSSASGSSATIINKNGLDLVNKNDNSSSISISINSNNSNNINSVKRERLSPPGNGDVQSSISRSRSATPSSFPGTPPQSAHLTDIMTVGQQNLNSVTAAAANALVAAAQTRNSNNNNNNNTNSSSNNEFQARNYSDFMRSLAAKYNNLNDNTSSISRHSLFDPKPPVHTTRPSTSKETSGSPDIKRQNTNTQNIMSPQVPFVSSLLSSLPFSASVFPPLIDMSSTQALVTLARAAKEAELQTILKSSSKSNTPNISPTLRSTPVPQQTTVQSFLTPTRVHQQQQQQQRQNSPAPLVTSTASPLDLSSSTPQIKRPRIETSPQSNSVIEKSSITTTRQNTTLEKLSNINEPVAAITTTATTTTPIFIPKCQAQDEKINSWSVEDVCNFIGTIDICAEYVQTFRDQRIDGSCLPLLTEDHLIKTLSMKLGPALKLRSVLAKKLGGPCPCASCSALTTAALIQQHNLQLASSIAATTTQQHRSFSTLVPITTKSPSSVAVTTTTTSSSSSSSLSTTNNNNHNNCNQILSTLNENSNSNISNNSNINNNNNNNSFNDETVIVNSNNNTANNLNLMMSSSTSSLYTGSSNIPRSKSADLES